MSNVKFVYQPLILTTPGDQPSIPSPADLVPGDTGWNENSNLLVGQWAYNTSDDKWYYRGSLVGIQEFQGGSGSGSSTLFDLSDTDITLPIIDGSILVYDASASDWKNVSEIDADKLEGLTLSEILEQIRAELLGYDALTNITGVPSASGWYAISRWKSFNCRVKSILHTHSIGGLRYDALEVEGTVNSQSTDNWTISLRSTGNVAFTKIRLSQYTIGSDNYTYLEVYKDIANTGTFSIITDNIAFNTQTDSNFTYESLSFSDVSALTPVRRSDEYDSANLLYNRDNIVKLTTDGVVINTALKAGESSPSVEFYKLELGSWNMSSSEEHSIDLPTGVTFDKVLIDGVRIFNDTGTENIPLSVDGYCYADDSNKLNLVISSDGYFTNGDFSGTANRGTAFITVEK